MRGEKLTGCQEDPRPPLWEPLMQPVMCQYGFMAALCFTIRYNQVLNMTGGISRSRHLIFECSYSYEVIPCLFFYQYVLLTSWIKDLLFFVNVTLSDVTNPHPPFPFRSILYCILGRFLSQINLVQNFLCLSLANCDCTIFSQF